MCEQVPKRQYTLEELRLNSIEAERLLSPTDNTLSTVRTTLQARFPVVPCGECSPYLCYCEGAPHATLHGAN